MTQLPKTENPLVIRTDFENQQAWETICDLIRAPVTDYGEGFYANVEFLDLPEFRNLSQDEVLKTVGPDYDHSFLMIVDSVAVRDPEFPILVVDLYAERGSSFRAIPTMIQGIENNLSLANMDFFEFADNVSQDGVFRGFS
jgi:hypothetical protein